MRLVDTKFTLLVVCYSYPYFSSSLSFSWDLVFFKCCKNDEKRWKRRINVVFALCKVPCFFLKMLFSTPKTMFFNPQTMLNYIWPMLAIGSRCERCIEHWWVMSVHVAKSCSLVLSLMEPSIMCFRPPTMFFICHTLFL